MRAAHPLSRPIRVLHLCDKMAVEGGVAGIARSLSLVIPRHSARVVSRIYTLRPEDPGCRFLVSHGVSVASLGVGKFNPFTLSVVLGVIKQEQPDIIHTHGYASSNFGRLASWITGIPVLLEENFAFHLPWYQQLADRLLSPLSRRGVAISESIKEFMVRRPHFAPERVAVVYRGIAFDAEPPKRNGHDATGDAIKVRYGIPADHQVVTVVARLHAAKGQDVVLRAAPVILQRLPRVTFLFAGEGAQRRHLETLAGALQVEASVRFPGFIADVTSLYEESDVIVVPSLSEAFGNAALEAMQAGCAIVASRVEGLAEVVREGIDGVLVHPGDPQELAARVIELLESRELRVRLAGQARKGARRFSIESSVRGFEALYEELAA